MRRLLIPLLLALGVQACGNKGPLYLPPAEPVQPVDHKSKGS